jgi:hypothetical protein
MDALELPRDASARGSMMNLPGRKGSSAATVGERSEMATKRASRGAKFNNVFGQS